MKHRLSLLPMTMVHSTVTRRTSIAALLGAVIVCSTALAAPGTQVPDDIDANLARVPRPWVKKMHQLTFAEYEATLKYWAARYPGLVTLERRGESHDGMGVYLLKITDVTVSDEDKQVCLVTALHGGAERSGTTSTLHLIEWLLGNSVEAIETRRKQVVLFMPIPNPHAYFVRDRFGNAELIDTYNAGRRWWDFKTLTLTDPQRTPEIAAVLSVIDEYQPEVHTDLHGVGMQEIPHDMQPDRRMPEGQMMFEVSGNAYSNSSLRPWDPRVTEIMVRAGQEAGYGSDRAEADAQRLFWGADYDVLSDRAWTGRPLFYTAHYGYAKYHTMITTTEVGWEESGVVRNRALIALGNKPWVDEIESGYPVNRVKAFIGNFITAYGRNASERRRSRVDLWEKQGHFAQAVIYPQFAGRATYVCATTPAGIAALDADFDKFLSNLGSLPGVNADMIGRFIKAGPELKLGIMPPANRNALAEPIRHGIGFRLRIPYRNPEMLDIRVNGHLLQPSAVDGYQCWWADGYTQLQVNLSPEKAKAADLFVVTCAYRPDVERNYGWTPPAEVLKQLGQAETK